MMKNIFLVRFSMIMFASFFDVKIKNYFLDWSTGIKPMLLSKTLMRRSRMAAQEVPSCFEKLNKNDDFDRISLTCFVFFNRNR